MVRAFVVECPHCHEQFLAFLLGIRRCPTCKGVVMVGASAETRPVLKPGLTTKEQIDSQRLLESVFGKGE